MKTNRLTSTDKVELVETHNLLLSLNRMAQPPFDSRRWRRAFYHALSMSDLRDNALCEKVRIALELP